MLLPGSTIMAKPNKLADLKLVNKYYPPSGLNTYSHRSPKLDTTFQFERPVGRSSVGSDASVPDMVDDRESIIFTDEEDKNSYHLSGAELWDKFWEDPFWEANAEEAKRDADGVTHKIINRHASYPALIPSPAESLPKDQYFLGHREAKAGDSAIKPFLICTWPLAVAEPPTSPRPVTPKASYSLFPRQTPTSPAILNLSPRKPNYTPRTTSPWSSPENNDSTVSLNSLGRSSRVTKARSDVSLSKVRSSWTLSGLVIPAITSLSPPLVESSSRKSLSRSDSSHSTKRKQRFPIKVSRPCSDTPTSHTFTISAPQPAVVNTSLYSVSVPNRPTTQPPRPPRSPEGFSGRTCQKEARKIPPPLLLQRTMTETELPSYHHRQSRISSHVYPQTNPSTPTIPHTPIPMPVSVFESDSEDSDEEETSFARRIARSFTSQKRTRSASAAPRSRKGQEVVKQQLKCARAELSGPSSSGEEVEASGTRVADAGSKESRAPRLRKQKSEVFGKVFWNRK